MKYVLQIISRLILIMEAGLPSAAGVTGWTGNVVVRPASGELTVRIRGQPEVAESNTHLTSASYLSPDPIRRSNETLRSNPTPDRDCHFTFRNILDTDLEPMDKGSGEQVRVDVCVVFLKIGEIDTLKEQYEADVMIKAKWREPLLDKCHQENALGPIDWSTYWNPKIFIENTIGEPRETAYQMLSYDMLGDAYVIEKRRVKGTFLENLELFDFPFDVQDLTVTIMSDHPASDIDLCEDPYELHKVNRQSFIDEQEWRLYKCIETELKEITNEYEGPTVRRSSLHVKCRAARRPAYFFWNIFLITFLISTLVFVTFSVDRNLPQNRLQLSFTLVLTSVAFKFVVNQSLPKISYLTYLDKYVLAAMILLTSVCCWHGLAAVLDSHECVRGEETLEVTPENTERRRVWGIVDTSALATFAGIYVLFNIIFILLIYLKPGRKRREMSQFEREYADKIEEQLTNSKKRKHYQIQPMTISPV